MSGFFPSMPGPYPSLEDVTWECDRERRQLFRNEAKRATLRELGGTYGQGYLFGRPAERTHVMPLRLAVSG